MNPEFLNMYIEQLITEIGENAKSRILLQTQLRYTESVNGQLTGRISELENEIVNLQNQLQSQQEKLNKKKSKEVNTSDDQF